MRVLVMGGSRFMGVKLVERLLEGGHDVTIANRGTRNPTWSRPVQTIVGDRYDPDVLQQLADRRPLADVVHRDRWDEQDRQA